MLDQPVGTQEASVSSFIKIQVDLAEIEALVDIEDTHTDTHISVKN